MKKDEKKTYAALALNIEIISEDDIISTSGFLGGDDTVFNPQSQTPAAVNELYPLACSASYDLGSSF